MRIRQAMNALDPTDAVTLHLFEMDRMLVELGHETKIYAEHAHPSLDGLRRPIAELAHAEGDLLLFHYAGFSKNLGIVSSFRGRKGVVYHNVTPGEFYRGFPDAFEFCEQGRKQLPLLAKVFDFGVGDSTFNVEELRALGMKTVRVLPIPWETSGLLRVPADRKTADAMKAAGPNILVVGRVAPPKRVLETVRAMPAIQRVLGSKARLTILGRTRGYESYVREIEQEIEKSGLRDQVVLAGEVRPEVLRAAYENAQALLVLSEHEGFCLPIAEAMGFEIPVVAVRAGAIEETLGTGGVLIGDREPQTIARALAAVLDPSMLPELRAQQRIQRESFSRERVRETLRSVLEEAASLPHMKGAAPGHSVSVVVCTYNRDWVLEKCLTALRAQDLSPFEVVVVNGPSTDRTSEVLDRFPDVKRVENPKRNLSISRNLGIQASSGDLIAFIDDDAVAEADWLEVLRETFQDPTVAGAGGVVYGPGGDHFQFRNGTITRYGMPIAIRDEPGEFCAPRGEQYNIVMGTNAMFRRSALEAVGGFDENYEYYHDESDLCVRLIQDGGRIVHVSDAVVWHEFEKSRIRKTVRDFNWAVVDKNTIYFYFCVNRWKSRPWDVLSPLRACLIHCGIFTRWFVRGEIGFLNFCRSWIRWWAGIVLGYAKGLFVAPRRRLNEREASKSFRPFGQTALRAGVSRRNVVLVSQQYPPDSCGGIGVYTEILARGLVEAGHHATVIAAGKSRSTEWREGVRVVRVPGARVPRGIPFGHRVTRKNVARSLAVDAAIREIASRGAVDIVDAAIWDAEAFATCLRGQEKLVLRLTTPMAVVAETQGWPANDDLRLAAEMEWDLVRRAHAVVDSSGTIAKMLAERYGVRPGSNLVREIPFGIRIPPAVLGPRKDSEVRVLFVGRLEARKGFDVLAQAIPRVLHDNPHVRFWIAGEGDAGDRVVREVNDMARKNPGRIQLFGWVDDARRDELYASCDVFVAPSRYESFGLVYLEAMTRAKPCIACEAGGAARIVVAGETGHVVPPGEGSALAEAILDLARDREKRMRMGAAGRARAEQEFSVERMVEHTLALYDEILESRPLRPQVAAEALLR